MNPWTTCGARRPTAIGTPARRLHELESDGIVAEVLFPNTIPPFFPSGQPPGPAARARRVRTALGGSTRPTTGGSPTSAPKRPGAAPAWRRCSSTTSTMPLQRCDWAKDHGLFGGILLPGVPPDSELDPLFAPDYDPHLGGVRRARHASQQPRGAAGPAAGELPRIHGGVHGRAELVLPPRLLAHGLWGSFRPLPGAQIGSHRAGMRLGPSTSSKMLDHQYAASSEPGTAESHFGGGLVEQVTEPPSYYWRKNCFAGASFFRPSEATLRHEIGISKIMWGRIIRTRRAPTRTATEALRNTFAGIAPMRWRRWSG